MSAAVPTETLGAIHCAQSLLCACVQARQSPHLGDVQRAVLAALVAVRPDAPQVPIAQALAVHLADALELLETVPSQVSAEFDSARLAIADALDLLATVADRHHSAAGAARQCAGGAGLKLIVDNAEATAKAFGTLRARLALVGYALTRSDPADGASRYYAARHGIVRELRDEFAVVQFAEQVGAPA